MKTKLTFLLSILIISTAAFSQEVLTLDSTTIKQKHQLSELAWLTELWTGEGLGGTCDEVWMPQMDNAMQGIFRYSKDGKVVFTEYMIIEQLDSNISLKLKHFSKDLTPWEEKDKWITFELIKIEGTTAYFNGLTYSRKEDELTIKLNLHSGDKKWVEEFTFKKTEL